MRPSTWAISDGLLSGRVLQLHLVLSFALLAAGCQRPTPPVQPTASYVDAADLDSLWDASLRILRRHDFQPDRQDRAAGIITTFPTTSAQWHEPWRRDVADGYGLLMASMHTVQRQVTVRFIHENDGPRSSTSSPPVAPSLSPWSLDVQVDVFLLSAPDYQITSSSSAIRSFSGDLPTITGESVQAREARRWVPMGRDGSMEDRLLNSILAYQQAL